MKCALLSRLKEYAKGQTLTVEKEDIIRFIIMTFFIPIFKSDWVPQRGLLDHAIFGTLILKYYLCDIHFNLASCMLSDIRVKAFTKQTKNINKLESYNSQSWDLGCSLCHMSLGGQVKGSVVSETTAVLDWASFFLVANTAFDSRDLAFTNWVL